MIRVNLSDKEIKMIDMLRDLNIMYSFGKEPQKPSRDMVVRWIVTKYLDRFTEKARNFE